MSNNKIVKRKSELFRRIKPSTMAKLLKATTNFESVYNFKDQIAEADKEISDTESIYSMKSNFSQFTMVTITTDQLNLNVRSGEAACLDGH